MTVGIERRKSRQIDLGGVAIGGDAPVSIQSMTTTKTADINATLQQIASLVATGVDIVRVAVPHREDAEALVAIAAKSTVPVVADIHFQWKYAMAALEAGIQGLRINPGNIKYDDKVRLIAREAKARGVPIRIGVNAGSLEPALLARHGSPTPEALVESALREARILEDEDFFDIKISVKHSNPLVMIESYRQLAEACDYPLHLGVTEAGPMPMGGVKSAVGIGTLLAEGIGDTIRVSLTDDPVEEVKVATTILQSLGLRRRGLDLVACPSCGRAEVNVLELTQTVNAAIENEKLHGADAGGRDGVRRERSRRSEGSRRRHRERQRTRLRHPSRRGRREGARGRAGRRAADRGPRGRGREGRGRRGENEAETRAGRAQLPAAGADTWTMRRSRVCVVIGRPIAAVLAVVPCRRCRRSRTVPARHARSSAPTTSGTWMSLGSGTPEEHDLEAQLACGLDRPAPRLRATLVRHPFDVVGAARRRAFVFDYASESDHGPTRSDPAPRSRVDPIATR